jgi:flagellar export protein FliJ
MGFRFALASILRYEKSLESQQELLLQAANRDVARVRLELEAVTAVLSCTDSERQRLLSQGARASEMHFLAEYQRSLTSQERQLRRALQEREVKRHELLEIFQQIRRKRELMETLRDRQLHAFREQQGREQQRRVDDLHLMTRTISRKVCPGS